MAVGAGRHGPRGDASPALGGPLHAHALHRLSRFLGDYHDERTSQRLVDGPGLTVTTGYRDGRRSSRLRTLTAMKHQGGEEDCDRGMAQRSESGHVPRGRNAPKSWTILKIALGFGRSF